MNKTNTSNLVVLEKFQNATQANIVKSLLETFDIYSYIADSHFNNLMPHLGHLVEVR